MDLEDLNPTPATVCTSPRWPVRGIAVVGGLGGMRDSGETLAFAPRLPRG